MTPDLDSDPDEPSSISYGDVGDPQSLNVYAYVRNNPLNRIDPDGHRTVCNSSTTTDSRGNIKVVLTCHEEPDSQPSLIDMMRAFFGTSDPEAKRAIGTAVVRDIATGNGNTGNLNDLLPRVATNANMPPPPTIPLKALKVLDAVDLAGSPGPGIQGGKNFENDGRGGGQVLPPTDEHGNAIRYKEWDVNSAAGGKRDAQRIVTGSDGSAYYTSNHYQTFEKIR